MAAPRKASMVFRIPVRIGTQQQYPVACSGSRHFTGTGIPPKPKCNRYDKDGFRIFQIPGLHKVEDRDERKFDFAPQQQAPPREKAMHIDQDWTNVWPTAATFKPSVVPLPIRQGHVKNSGENEGITPGKYSNMELVKVVNFLHLTPRHIKKHCAALKRFCTPWPRALNDDARLKQLFPLAITTQDYVYGHSNIRDPRSRKVTMKFRLSSLELDDHARDKMIRLLGTRYDKESDEAVLQADKCPVKKQNTDYVHYLLTALYYESWKIEEWESEKTWADLETYVWDRSKTKDKITDLVEKLPHAQEEVWRQKHVSKYAEAVTKLHNKGENTETLREYKKAVLDMFKLKTTSQYLDEASESNMP